MRSFNVYYSSSSFACQAVGMVHLLGSLLEAVLKEVFDRNNKNNRFTWENFSPTRFKESLLFLLFLSVFLPFKTASRVGTCMERSRNEMRCMERSRNAPCLWLGRQNLATRSIVIALLFWISGTMLGQSPATFEAANAAYSNADFKSAITQYESILAKGEHSPEVYYNLANSYYKENQLGKAILNYERALLLKPKDEHTRFNLALAKRKVKGEIDPVPPFFLLSWWQTCRTALSSTAWGVIALLLFWAGMAGLSLWQLGKDSVQKKKGFFGGIALISLCILPLALAWSAYRHQNDTDEAILVVVTASLKSGADENSTEIRPIYEGTKLMLLDQIGIWYKVRLENGETGWLTGSSFEEI
jgi:tetratricopeptide (TPR) repeat protein